MKSSIEDLAIVLLTISVTLFLGFILYKDINGQVPKSTEDRGEPVAILTFKENNVLHKFGNSEVWDDTERGIDIYNYDSIRTGENANAILTMGSEEEGNLRKIKIGNNTMIRVITDESDGIQLAIGSFGANGEDIIGEESIVTLNSGTVAIETNQSGELSVEVEKGSAQIEVDGEVREITDSKKAVIGKTSGLAIEEVNILPLLPLDPAIIITKVDLTDVLFSWSLTNTSDEPVLLEVAIDSSFSKIILSERVSTLTYNAKLSTGNYYWRISLAGNVTRNRRLSVLKEENLKPTFPNGDVITYSGQIPEISFKWRGAERANSYLIEVFEAQNTTTPIQTFQSEIGFKKWKPNKEGDYLWKVTPYYDNGGYTESSALVSFKVISRKNVSSPDLQSPRPGYVFQPKKDEVNVQFSWKSIGSGTKYRFILYRNSENRGNIIDEFTTKDRRTSRIFREEGSFLWKVHAFDGENNLSEDAVSRSFKVKFPKKTEINYPPIALNTPVTNTKLDFFELLNGKIFFNWKKQHRSVVRYEIKVGQTKALDDNILSFVVKNNSVKMASLSTGKYYWQVSGFDKNGRILSRSPIDSFLVSSNDTLVGIPIVKKPSLGEDILIDKVGNLNFSWYSLGQGITYQLTLVNSATKEIIFIKSDIRNSSYIFTDMSKLSVGKFYYNLQAFKEIPELGMRKSGQVARINFTISLSVVPQVPVIEGIIIEEESEKEIP